MPVALYQKRPAVRLGSSSTDVPGVQSRGRLLVPQHNAFSRIHILAAVLPFPLPARLPCRRTTDVPISTIYRRVAGTTVAHALLVLEQRLPDRRTRLNRVVVSVRG